MSIQSNVNQALAVVGALYSQSPTAAAKKEKAMEAAHDAKLQSKLENDIKTRKNTIGDIVGRDEKGETLEITEHPELLAGKKGLERSIALDEADKKYVAAHEELAKLKPTKENIEALAHRKMQSEIRHNQRVDMLSYSPSDSEYVKEAIEREKANSRAEAKRKAKLDQMKPYENFAPWAKEEMLKQLEEK